MPVIDKLDASGEGEGLGAGASLTTMFTMAVEGS